MGPRPVIKPSTSQRTVHKLLLGSVMPLLPLVFKDAFLKPARESGALAALDILLGALWWMLHFPSPQPDVSRLTWASRPESGSATSLGDRDAGCSPEGTQECRVLALLRAGAWAQRDYLQRENEVQRNNKATHKSTEIWTKNMPLNYWGYKEIRNLVSCGRNISWKNLVGWQVWGRDNTLCSLDSCFPPGHTQRLHFPASLEVRNVHLTEFRTKGKRQRKWWESLPSLDLKPPVQFSMSFFLFLPLCLLVEIRASGEELQGPGKWGAIIWPNLDYRWQGRAPSISNHITYFELQRKREINLYCVKPQSLAECYKI